MCETCDEIQRILTANRISKMIRDGDMADLAVEALALTPQGRTVKTANTVRKAATPVAKAAIRSKPARAAGRRLSRALKEVNRGARTKGGKLKKGWSQAKIMSKAHKLAKRMR